MKRPTKATIAAVVGAAILSGCATTSNIPNQEQTCQAAAAAYGAYLAVINADGQPSQDQVTAAAGAAAFLTAYCGWEHLPQTTTARGSAVPIIRPPHQ